MKQLLSYRKPDRWATSLSVLISFSLLMCWLPFFRSMFDGESYSWGVPYFGLQLGGTGLTPSYMFLVAQIGLYLFIILGMYHMRNRKLYHGLLIVWWVNFWGNLLTDILINGDTVFHGDTMNIKLSISMLIIPLSVLAIFLIYMFIRSESRQSLHHPLSWQPLNTILYRVFLVCIPLQFVLLRFGEPHGTTDAMGVVLTIVLAFYLPLVTRPYISSGSWQKVQA